MTFQFIPSNDAGSTRCFDIDNLTQQCQLKAFLSRARLFGIAVL